MTSPEGDTIRRRTVAINRLIASNSVEYFGDRLVAEGFIDDQERNNIITAHGIGDYDKTSRLMSAARAKVDEDPSSFDRLITVLEDSVPSKDIVNQLKQEYNPLSPARRCYRRVKRVVSSVINLVPRAIAVIAFMGFVLACIVLNRTHVQDYVWNALTDLNVKNLLDAPTHFQLIKRQTELMNISSRFEALRQQGDAQEKTVVVYIVGPPAYGKTQLARQFAEEYYAKNKRSCIFRTLVVASVDATSELSLLMSYIPLAKELGLFQKVANELELAQKLRSYSMKDNVHILARAIAAELKTRQQGWLLILDNLTSHVERNVNATKWLPQPGSEDWGVGNVIITTQDRRLVPKANTFVAEYHLNHGMSEEDALALLQSLTGKRDDTKARDLVNNLYRLPLGILAAGLFIRGSRPDYSYSDYIQKLKAEDKFQEVVEEEVIKDPNLPYERSQMKALVIFIEQRAKDENLYKVFLLLAACANSPVPMHLVECAVAEQEEVKVYSMRTSVIGCSVLDVTITKSLDEGGIEIIKVHQLTWKALKTTFLSDDNRNQRQLLHDFANCTRKEYLRLSEVVQHQYIMEPHLEAFLRIEVPGLKLDISEQVQLRIVLALCYQFTRNSEKAQELMRETFEHSPVHLEEYSGDTVMALGLFYRTGGSFAEAELIFKRLLPIAEKQLGNQSILVGQICTYLGEVYCHMHMYNESWQYLVRALAIFKINGDPDYPLAYLLMVHAYFMQKVGRPDDALEYANRVASIIIANNRNAPDSYNLIKGLGMLFKDLGHFEKAVEVLEYSLEFNYNSEESEPGYVYLCSCLSILHHQLGNFTRSKEMADEVYKILSNGTNLPYLPGELQRAEILLRQRATLRRTVFIGRPVHETYLLATGVLAIMQGRFEEGRNTLEELVPGEDQAHLLRGIYANAKLALLELYFELGDRKQMLRTITLLKKMKGSFNVSLHMEFAPWRADPDEYIHIGRTTHVLAALVERMYHSSLGKVPSLHLNGWKAYYQGNHSTAETLLEQALQLQYQYYTPNNLLTAETLILSTVVTYCQGKQEEAMNYLQRAMAVLRTQYTQHPLVGKTFYVAGFLYKSLQNYDSAIMYFKEALSIAEQVYPSSHPMIAEVHNIISNEEIKNRLCREPDH